MKAPAWSQGGSLGSPGGPGQAEALTDLTGLANQNKINLYSVKTVMVEQTKMCEAHSQEHRTKLLFHPQRFIKYPLG